MKGSIARHKSGRYIVRLQVAGIRRTAYARSEREAQALLRRWQHEANLDGGLPTGGKRTLAELCEAWLAAADVRPTTRAWYEDMLRCHILPAIGSVKLERLTPDRIERLYRSLSPTLAHAAHRTLRRALAVAVRWRWLASNPCDRVERPKPPKHRPQLWTPDQLHAFIQAASDEPLLVLLAATGMRLGEALALRWKDVGLGGVAVTISATARWLKGRWVFNPPKTSAGLRTVQLPHPAIAALAHLRARVGDVSGDAFVFESRRVKGQPVHPSHVRHTFREACARAGVPRIRIHDLRHLHASLLLAEGVPVTEVAKRLGHASAQVTMSIYAHALGSQAASVAAMERVLKEAKREG